ncbi:hypothetical protein RintRC_0103 [Richelia intracellularis]|nr:hypothetical protein RintRC_0103 [Richelia intracellularis]
MSLQYPPKGRWRSLRLGTKCPSLGFPLENQDIPHNYVQQSVIFTTKLDALTLGLKVRFYVYYPGKRRSASTPE